MSAKRNGPGEAAAAKRLTEGACALRSLSVEAAVALRLMEREGEEGEGEGHRPRAPRPFPSNSLVLKRLESCDRGSQCLGDNGWISVLAKARVDLSFRDFLELTMVLKLDGNWDAGRAYDVHTVSSTHLGFDEFGHDRFETVRTQMGELTYRLKYKQDISAIPEIIDLLEGIPGIENFDYLVPIPPTNKSRRVQPVIEITRALGAKRNVSLIEDLITNRGDEELKGVTDSLERERLLEAAIYLNKPERIVGRQILLVDDLYRSGATLSVTAKLLKAAGATRVCVLTMTKTRSNR